MLRFILLSASFCLLPIFAVCTYSAGPKDDAPPADSKFSLTIYSTADPATFDPQQTAEERQSDPAYKIPGYGVIREIRKNHPECRREPGQVHQRGRGHRSDHGRVQVAHRARFPPRCSSRTSSTTSSARTSSWKKYLGKSVIINRKQEVRPGERMLPELSKPGCSPSRRHSCSRPTTSSSPCK